VQLQNVCELIVDCEHKTAPTQADGYPSIRTPNIGRGRFLLDGVNRVSEETYRLWTRRAVPQPGDLIMAREAPVGNVALVPEGLRPCLGQRTLLIRPDRRTVDAAYLMYMLLGPKVQEAIHSKTNGATVAHLNMSDVRELRLPYLPALDEQRRVASTLSAYDELVDNSQRRIRVLDEMARALYREWFVLYRYPGHEKTPLVDSPVGRVPKGWKVERLDASACIHRGRSYRSTDLADDGGVPFINLKCIDRDGGFRRNGIKRFVGKTPESHPVRRGDIVVAVTDMTQERRIVARAALVPTLGTDFGVLSMDLVRVEPLGAAPAAWLYAYLRYSDFADHLKQHANGANVLHLSPDRIRGHLIVVPPADLARRFADHVGPFFDLHDILENRIDTLKTARDLLLPRLLSGQLELPDAA
jgi:type I restriction enzyme S subunit